MTDTPASSAPAAPPPAPAAPQSPPAPLPYFPEGIPSTPAAFDAPDAVAARAEIKAKIGDRDFYKALIAERERGITGPASQLWSSLHARGLPSGPAIDSPAAVEAQANSRDAQAMNSYVQWIRQTVPGLTDAQEAEIRAGAANKQSHAWTRAEKDRLIKAGHARGG
jgi:hypothetical protein